MKKKVIIIVALILCFILSFFLIKDKRNITNIEASLKDLISFPLRIFSKNVTLEISSEVSDTFLTTANEDLKELKDTLDLNIVNTDIEFINSTVINRSSINYFDVITIDKGKYSGIKKGMCVINKDGFIGKIKNVTNTTSEIKLLNSETFNEKVSVVVSGYYGVISGYDSKKDVLLVEGIKDIEKITNDSKVVTSGLASLYPSGILIGKVVGKRKDSYNNLKYLEVKGQNTNEIHYVSVIKK